MSVRITEEFLVDHLTLGDVSSYQTLLPNATDRKIVRYKTIFFAW